MSCCFITTLFVEKFLWQRQHASAAFLKRRGLLGPPAFFHSAFLRLTMPISANLLLVSHILQQARPGWPGAPQSWSGSSCAVRLLQFYTTAFLFCSVNPGCARSTFLPIDSVFRYQHADPYHSSSLPSAPRNSARSHAVLQCLTSRAVPSGSATFLLLLLFVPLTQHAFPRINSSH